MAGKRKRWRSRDRRVGSRPKRPPPTSGWSVQDLAKLTGVTVRAIRGYLTAGFLESPPFRGTWTRYERGHVLRLAALRRCRADGARTLAEVRARISTMTEADLIAWIGPSASQPLCEVLGYKPPAPVPAENPVPGHRWILAPGVELFVASSIAPRERVLVDAIVALAKR